MKAKYKLDTFIEYSSDDKPGSHGRVTGILSTSHGFYYQVGTNAPSEFVPENKIVAAYRPVKTRAATELKSSMTKSRTRKSKSREAIEDLQSLNSQA